MHIVFTSILNIYSILHNHPIITHKIITIIIILIGINCVKISNLFLMSIIQIFFIFSWLTRGWLLGSSVTEEIRATIIDWLIQVCLSIQLNTHRGLKQASRKGNFMLKSVPPLLYKYPWSYLIDIWLSTKTGILNLVFD